MVILRGKRLLGCLPVRYPKIRSAINWMTPVSVDLGGLVLNLVLDVGLGGLMELLDVRSSLVGIHMCPLLEW